MLLEYMKSFFLIFMAEMGDKTQILAVIFATKYNARKVLLGVLIGSFLNHGIAVALGTYLSDIIPLQMLQITAGVMFVIFGLWTLKQDKEEDDETNKESKFGPIFTVAVAFFIGELGDKTQLMAITIAGGAVYPLIVLMGTVSGMILTSALGIFIGIKFGNKIPKFALKITSACIFLLFGIIKLYIALHVQIL